jgi:hypothetical protein
LTKETENPVNEYGFIEDEGGLIMKACALIKFHTILSQKEEPRKSSNMMVAQYVEKQYRGQDEAGNAISRRDPALTAAYLLLVHMPPSVHTEELPGREKELARLLAGLFPARAMEVFHSIRNIEREQDPAKRAIRLAVIEDDAVKEFFVVKTSGEAGGLLKTAQEHIPEELVRVGNAVDGKEELIQAGEGVRRFLNHRAAYVRPLADSLIEPEQQLMVKDFRFVLGALDKYLSLGELMSGSAARSGPDGGPASAPGSSRGYH